MSKRKPIKAHRKPKIVRDRAWLSHALSGDYEALESRLPRQGKILPPGRRENRVQTWTRMERELSLINAMDDDPAPEGCRAGVVIQVSTGLYDVDMGDEVRLCAVRGSLSASLTGYTNVVAVGDRVWVSDDGRNGGVIERVRPRRAVLARPDVFNPDRSQIIVSNVDQLLIVSSWVEPNIWLELIDRSLIVAAEGNMIPLICLNKVDMMADEPEVWDDCEQTMQIYRDLGYTVLYTSAATGQGVDELRQLLIGHETALVGMSGTGKSSLLMAVQPDLELAVADVSEYSGQGRHTTTQVSLLPLDEDGYVVDTPGIRELGLIKVRRHELILHFPEMMERTGQCRFNDCTHLEEPGCVVRQAVEDGQVAVSRYHSYCSIYESLPEYYTE